jgi:hypothetical protein
VALRKPKDTKGNLNRLNGVVMAVFCKIVRMDGNLVVGSRQADFGENGTTKKLVGVIMDMPDGVAVENGMGVGGSVIATRTPPVVLFGYYVKHQRQETLGVVSSAVLQYGVELGFGNGEPVQCQSPRSAGDRWARSSPDVVGSVVANFA